MPRGNPTYAIRAAETNDAETAISHCVAIGHCLQALLSRPQRPEDAAELLDIAAHAAVLKHLAQQQKENNKAAGRDPAAHMGKEVPTR